MTLWDTLRALWRRWPVVLAGTILATGFGWLAIREPGVYFTRMEVVFLAPSTWYRNVLQETPETVIITASAVSKRVVGAGGVVKYGSLEATLVGTSGLRDGAWVRAEDQGEQWAPDFRAPIIVVDVVGESPARVREIQYESIQQIRQELDRLQSELQPKARDRITIEVAPEATIIHRVRGDRVRALGMTALLGVVATTSAVWIIEMGSRRNP